MKSTVSLLCWALAAPVFAQVTTQTILGTVTDRTGALVPQAHVVAINVDTNITREADADDSGQYAIRFLPTGNYRVEISAPNFKKFTQSGIVLDINRTARVDAQLEPPPCFRKDGGSRLRC